MYRMPKGDFDGLVGLIKIAGGNFPISDSGYHGSARVVKTYSKGRKTLTPDGEKELLLGVDVEVSNWIDGSLQDYMNQLGVGELVGSIREGRINSRSQYMAELQRLKQVNTRAKPRVLPFYMTPDGIIYYKITSPNEFPTDTDLFANVSGMFEVPKSGILEAEESLKSIAIVSYMPKFMIASLMGSNGLVIDDAFPTSMMGEELRVLE